MRSLRSISVIGLVATALVASWIGLLRNNCYCAAGPDSSGYLNEARLFAAGRLSFPIEPLRTFGLDAAFANRFTPIGFTLGRDPGTMVPTYPPGLPLLIAIAAMIGGWSRAAFLIVPLSVIGCLVLMAMMARSLGFTWAAAGVGAIALAAYPIFIFQSLVSMSDVPATFFVLLTLFLGLRSRERPQLAFLAGAAFGASVWIRPSNMLVAVALACALRWRFSGLQRAIAGALPFGIVMMWLNATWYGNPLRTGYGTVTEVSAPSAFGMCSGFHLKWVVSVLTPLILAGLFAVADRGIDGQTRAMLAAWFAAFFGFYAIYPVCSSWTDTRFLMPAIPALIFGLLWLMQKTRGWLEVRWPHRLAAGLAAILALAVVSREVAVSSRIRVFRADDYDHEYVEVIRWARPQMRENSVVMAGLFSGPLLFYTNRAPLRWDLIEDAEFEHLRELASHSGVTWYALVSDSELPPSQFRLRYKGAWSVIARHGRETLWRLE